MHDDMILNMDDFDFNMIDADDSSGVDEQAQRYLEPELPEEGDEEEWGYSNEEESTEEVDEESGLASIDDLAQNFDTLPEDVAFTINGEAVSKKEIAEIVKTRSDLKEASEGLSDYVSNLSEVEMRVQSYLAASMSETETRLRQIEQMLNQPERMTPTELQKAYIAQRDLRARQTVLEQNAANVRDEEIQRRQAVNMMKINQTNAQLKASVPGWKGKDSLREVASWAQQQGLKEDSLVEAMSPEFIKILMDAKMYREKVSGKKAIVEKARAKPAAQKSVSSKPKSSNLRGAVGERQRAAAYDKAMKAGDSSAAFNFLMD